MARRILRKLSLISEKPTHHDQLLLVREIIPQLEVSRNHHSLVHRDARLQQVFLHDVPAQFAKLADVSGLAIGANLTCGAETSVRKKKNTELAILWHHKIN